MALPARQIAVSIERPLDQVYAFASDPAKLPLWAAGLSGSTRNAGGEWIAESPRGTPTACSTTT
jgi:uncharacterized membrane protein